VLVNAIVAVRTFSSAYSRTGLECCCRDDVLRQRIPDPGGGAATGKAWLPSFYSAIKELYTINSYKVIWPLYSVWVDNHIESNVKSLCGSEVTGKIKLLKVEGHAPVPHS